MKYLETASKQSDGEAGQGNRQTKTVRALIIIEANDGNTEVLHTVLCTSVYV